MLLDIHTHRLPADASAALLSCCMRDVPLPEGARFISAGIHPWYLTREDYPRQLEWVVSMLNDRRVIALGEAGLDKRCDTPFDLQVEAFQAIALLASRHRLPLLIHAVKSSEELIALKKRMKPENAGSFMASGGKRNWLKVLSGRVFICRSAKNIRLRLCRPCQPTGCCWKRTRVSAR